MKAITFALLTVFGFALPSAHAQLQEFGPWRIGMSKTQAQSFPQYGPYQLSSMRGGNETLRSAPKIEFLGDRISVTAFTGTDGKIDSMQVNVLTTDRESKAARAVEECVGYLTDKLDLPDRDDFFESFDLTKHLKEVVKPGPPNMVYSYRFTGHDYLRVRVSKALGGTSAEQIRENPVYHCTIRIGNAKPDATPTTNPSDPSNPSDPDPDQPPALQDWSFQVPGGEAQFKRRLASVHALLVRPIGNGGNAAQAMKLSATAVPGNGTQLEFSFNQPVGSDMSRASEEVVRAIQVKHGTLPSGMNVEFGFADKWGGKDGPSAAVATALLIESMLGGFEIPESLAVTGDLNADQTVQPVGGVGDKIRGAMAKKCLWIGVPAANEEDLDDLVVEESLRRFLSAKVFTLRSLDDALTLADAGSRSDVFNKALIEFDAIQQSLKKGGAAALYSAAMQTRLNAVIAAVPNLYSAKALMAASRKQTPARFSLAGTLVRIDEAMAPFTETIDELRAGVSIENFQFGRNNPMSEARNRLKALKAKSDPRLLGVIDAQQKLIERTQTLINSNTKSTTVFEKLLGEMKAAGERADAQWQQVIDNQQIQDQLMKRGIQFE